MQTTLSVTEQEYDFPENTTLMSTTDLDSYIIYGNEQFFEVSGYSSEELLGQPHNVVRHPDMPAQVFADMWRTLKGGEPWTGLVKNKRKDGGFYWVRASVNPVVRGGTPIGYLSVRTKPSREEVAQASLLYQKMRQGEMKGFRMHKGLLLRRGLGCFISALKTLPLRWRIRVPLLTLLPITLAAGWYCRESGSSFLIFSLMLAALLALTALWLETQISRPLERIAKQAIDIATGASLKVDHVDRIDELGLTLRAVGQLGLMFRWLIDDVSGQVMSVRSASHTLAEGNTQLSLLIDETAANVQETAAAMQQITATIAMNVSNTAQADLLSHSASDAASSGGTAMSGVVSTMDEIASSSDKITSIISVIDSIAFQTNILALNAAVEAARAGSEGKGFAVVAGEVRNLAQHSAKSAAEIKLLVQTSTENIRSGIAQVHDAGVIIHDIVHQVDKVTALLAEIRLATSEQGTGLSDINTAVDHLGVIIHKNATYVHEGSVASESMRQQSDLLAQALNVFRQREA